jgi:uncharacterized protein with FMN-binding domain
VRKTITTLLVAAVIALPVADATAAVKATSKKKVVTRRFAGSTVQVDRYGPLEVTIVVRKTTTITGSKTKVSRKIVGLSIPVYPNESGRSQYISQNALPILRSEALKAQSASVNMISGATYTSESFAQSLQSAILKASRG